jgi:aspartyl protease family protein
MNVAQDGPSIIWGVVCALLLVSSLAARRLPLSQVVKMALAWIAIFALAFAIFSFRFEFQNVWQRMTSDVSGTSGQVVNGEKIALQRQDDGHYWIQLDVNNNPVRFMIDSGATTTAMNSTAAINADIDIDIDGFPVLISTANGEVTARRGVIRKLQIGAMVIENHHVVVSENFGETNVLGMNFLESFKSWSVEGRIMTLQP